jgi:uncharacterized protein YpuA (DUF1002 family)
LIFQIHLTKTKHLIKVKTILSLVKIPEAKQELFDLVYDDFVFSLNYALIRTQKNPHKTNIGNTKKELKRTCDLIRQYI